MRRDHLALAILLSGCGDDAPPGETPAPPIEIVEGCNPIGLDADCLLPFPSDVYLSEGGDGRRVSIPEVARVRANDAPVDMYAMYPPDGFSHAAPILVALGEAIDDESLVFHTGDVTRSLTIDSPTLLLDAETGEPVLHFSELDPRALDDARRALIIRPLVKLESDRRYVVALRGLSRADGTALPAPARFANLRDRGGDAHPALEALSARYEGSVFPVLEGFGVPRDEIQLAWDFTTQTEASVTRDMLAIRQDVMTRLDTAEPEISIVSVEDDVSPSIGRKIDLVVGVPLYLETTEPGARLNRDEAGGVVAMGTAEVPVRVLVPPSVMNRPPGAPPARLLQFGHGFFGSRDESLGFPAELAEEKGFVVVAADWWGFSDADQSAVADAIVDDLSEAARMGDRVHQAMANLMYAARAARGPILDLAELQVSGEPAYDPTAIYFYGISMGHILGGTYVALSPDVERAALSVGGANFSMMLFRSQAFGAFLALIGFVVDDRLDQQKLGVLLQSMLDRFDPMTYARFIGGEPLAGSPEKKVLLHAGLGDLAVPNLATEAHARTLGLGLLAPATRPVVGLVEIAPPTGEGAFVEFDFGIDPLPSIQAEPSLGSNDVHEAVRRLEASKAQVDGFLRPGGSVEQTCEGICDPE